jgi:diacylglycerol kinase family enzyme
MRNVCVILNARAGALLDRDPADVRRDAEAALRASGRGVDVVLARGRGIVRAIERAATSGSYDTLIVGGGDGSMSCAAHHLANKPIALGVLPLGTLNLLARDLGMPTDLGGALTAVAEARPSRIDLAAINGRFFHSLSGLGFFSQMARAREEARDLPTRILRLGAAALHAFARTGRLTLEFDIEGRCLCVHAFAVLVTCNRFGREDWRRDALDGGMLEIHLAEDEGALARLKAGFELLTGGWRDDPAIRSYSARSLRIAGLRRRSWVATDGELCRETMPLAYKIAPRALTVLAPRPPASAASPPA